MAEQERKMRQYGCQTIKHPWFSGLRAVMRYFIECTEHEEKARIVIEYDPREDNTRISYYREIKETESEGSPNTESGDSTRFQ